MSRDQHAKQNRNIKTGNRSFEKVEHHIFGNSYDEQNSTHVKLRADWSQRMLANIRCRSMSSNLLSKNLKIKICKYNCNFPFVLYGCETWSLTLKKEHRLRLFENRVLRRIFADKRDEITENWRRLHMEALYGLYWPNIIRMMKSRRMR